MIKNKKEIIFLTLASILYLVTRLINLKIIPVFTDEAIYMFWAQTALNDPANRFISLEDGKQPLFIWVASAILNFIKDPLVALRLVSVLSGLFAFFGIYLLAKEIFNEKIGRLSAFFYVVLPFPLLYDRLGLYDSFLTMLGIFAVFLTVKLAKNPRLDNTLLDGVVIGCAMITKSSGNFFQYLLPFSILFFDFKSKNFLKRFFKWISFIFLTFAISTVIYNALRLSQFFYIIERKNSEFIRPLSEVLNDPFLFFMSNFKSIFKWFAEYTSWPLVIVFLIGLFVGNIKKDKRIFYLSILIILPFSLELFFNKVLYARFMLFYYPYTILILSYGFFIIFDKFKKYKNILLVIFTGALLIPIFTSFKLFTSPTSAKIPQNDSLQYLNDWPAGYGVKEIVNILQSETQNKKIIVGTEGTFGLFPYVLNVYFFKNENIKINAYWPVNPERIPSEILESSKNQKTYFIFNENQKEISNPRLKLITKYQKGIGNSFMRLYEVLP